MVWTLCLDLDTYLGQMNVCKPVLGILWSCKIGLKLIVMEILSFLHIVSNVAFICTWHFICAVFSICDNINVICSMSLWWLWVIRYFWFSVWYLGIVTYILSLHCNVCYKQPQGLVWGTSVKPYCIYIQLKGH